MAVISFSSPVYLRLERPGFSHCVVTNIEQCWRILIEEWPVEPGPKYLKARETCLRCRDGECDPEKARQAFIEAAEEAGILAR